MPTYKYQALSPDGAEVSGVIDAINEIDAIDRVKQTCPVVTKVTKVIGRASYGKPLFSKKISEKSLALVCSQFSIILRAGLPMVRAVSLIANQTADKALREILLDVADGIAAGQGLADSFAANGPSLPATFVETIRAGEESGTLDVSFERLQEYFEKSVKVKSKVKGALTYPALVGIVAVVVIYVIMTTLVPTLIGMFSSLGTDMPFPTRALIALSNFFVHYGVLLIGGIAAVVVACFAYSTTERGRIALSRFKLALPVFGNIQIMQSASQFANTMSTLLAAGLPMNRALTVTARAMTNYAVGLDVESTIDGVEEGRRLGECLKRKEVFPELLIEMTSVGEETGSLESTLDTISVYYDSEVINSTERAMSLLEPAITIFIAVFVVFLLLAVYLPMFSIYGSM